MRVPFFLALLLGLVGCGPSQSQIDADIHKFHETSQNELDALQWRIDDKTAANIFGLKDYLAFHKCHEDRSKSKQCERQHDRVTRAEAANQKS